ncbi:MAG: HlyD family type I secretion periplasmic adaptor subunit [Magnetococcales bacterium]|nr:HlyD family type I secretion periplasmic adaptor subunit [Magnetococcales bacterium]
MNPKASPRPATLAIPGLLGRLPKRPQLAGQILISTLMINLLGLGSSIYVTQVYNRYMGHGIDGTLITLSSGLILAMVMEYLLRSVRHRLAEAVTIRPERELKEALFERLTRVRPAALHGLPDGHHLELLRGVDTLQAAHAPGNLLIAMDLPFALLFLGVVHLFHPALGLATLVILLVALLVTILGGARTRLATRAVTLSQARQGSLAATLRDTDTIRVCNMAPLLLDRWRNRSRETRRLRYDAERGQMTSHSWMQILNAAMTLTVTALGAKLVITGTLDIGTLFGANILATRALVLISRFAQLGSVLAQARQARQLLEQFARLPVEPTSGTMPTTFSGRIEFKDVAFQYPDAPTPLFESLSFTLEPGAILMVTGDNGTGKSTLARLCAGLLEPTRGLVLADGMDIRQIHPEWWRSQLVYQPQETTLIPGTLRDNLAVLAPGATDEALRDVLERVGLTRFRDESEQGLDRQLTGGDGHLAPGIRRRLSLARAMLTDGPLVLLDEPLEGMDHAGRELVTRLMREWNAQGRTVILLSSGGTLKADGATLDLNSKPVPTLTAVGVARPLLAPHRPRPSGNKEIAAPPGDGLEPGESIPGVTHLFWLLSIVLLAGFGLWAHLSMLDVVSIASGEVVPAGRVQQVQHLEGGMVREILVREGDRVNKDQPLVTLDAIANQSDVETIRMKIRALRVDLHRLHAEAEGRESVDFDALRTLMTSDPDTDESDKQLIQQARELFDARRKSLTVELRSQREQIDQRVHEIAEIEKRIKASQSRLGLLNEQIAISAKLLASENTSRYEHLNLLKEQGTLRGSLEGDETSIKRGRAALKQAEEGINLLLNRHRQEARTQMVEAQRTLDEMTLRLRKLADSAQRTVLRAPVNGTIKTLRVTGAGGVVPPGGTVLEIVPGEDRLIVEAKLPPQDVGHVRLEQPAVIRLAARDGDRFGKIDGQVRHISPDTLITREGSPYYLVRVVTARTFFANGPDRYELVPGVMVTIGIVTGQRSVLEYLLEPLLHGMRFAMSER